ncbi:TolC family protein [Sulfurimonas sp. HSL3-7]|uniref:TolC family protein n=1 Tax=Sulfonitrofixus jiaomeiensis TaxID=3131938 RepID=UPI0031F80F1C
MRTTLFVILFTLTAAQAQTLGEIMQLVDTNPQLKTAEQKSRASTARYASQQSANYPSLDALYSATYLFEKPVVYLSTPGAPTAEVQIQSQNQYDGALRLTYPLFTGFAASSAIDMAKSAMQRSLLEAEDVRRNLYLGTINAYATAVAAEQFQSAQEEALDAIKKSYEKAKGMFEQGMAPPSELYRIEASYHAIESAVIRARNQYRIALNTLSFLADSTISEVSALPQYQDLSEEALLTMALQKRPDLQALKKILAMQQSRVELEKSDYYPTVTLYAQLAQHGDDWRLDGDGYTNKDRSAAGFTINYNLFGGFKSKYAVEAAREEELSVRWMITSYEEEIKKEIKESYLNFVSLKSQLEAQKAQVKARQAYYAFIKGEFDNQLTDADRLSRAVSSLAAARSSLAAAQARAYGAYAHMLLQVDVQTFQDALYPVRRESEKIRREE